MVGNRKLLSDYFLAKQSIQRCSIPAVLQFRQKTVRNMRSIASHGEEMLPLTADMYSELHVSAFQATSYFKETMDINCRPHRLLTDPFSLSLQIFMQMSAT